MSSVSITQSILDEFGEKLGTGAIALDAEGRATMSVGPLEITFAHDSEPVAMLWLYADLGPMPEDEAAPTGLLTLGYISWMTGAMTIAATDDGTRVFGYTSIPLAMLTVPVLEENFQRLLISGIEVQRRLAAGDFAELPTDVALDDSADTTFRPDLRV
ncbi:MAG: type III secretion system chaperone [Pseudomonadota bacterium]